MKAHVSVERLTETTIAAADRVVMAAYAAPSRAAELRRNLALQPDGWRVARVAGKIVGVGGAVDYGPFASIGQVGVLPTMQRRGIATALMRDLLDWLDARGCPVVLLDASADGAHLYPPLGFVPDDIVTVWQRETELIPMVSSRAEVVISSLTLADLRTVASFDAPRFGADRSAVLASFADDLAGRTFVARDAKGAITGYLFAQSATLGPWMATTPESARALLARALTLPFEAAPRVLAPAANAHAEALLRATGFVPVRQLQHMRRGGVPLLERRRAVYGQCSFALG